ncbi:MAG: hypothetical protein JO040_03295 [Gemmatimonadetes bacterium]|nr:hypothetical protein [Gemmatimonadota bacterium]
MAENKRTRGACAYCGREFARAGMTRHLASCPEREKVVEAANGQPGETGPLIHLQVQDAWGGDYWLHLEMAGSATLKQLDKYLRAIWLECCGHLSQFSVGGWRGEEIGMTRKAAQVFRLGVELTHIYDFGTESVTLVRAMDTRTGRPTTRHPIALMARNLAPGYECQECGGPATRLCLECAYEDERPGTLCGEHARGHPHEDYGEPMPLVNSPRVGLCGYEGPAEPPY